MAGRPGLIVVGGGPAGLSAAAEASAWGVRATVIEEAPRLGGQYYRGRQGSASAGSPRWFGQRNGGTETLSRTAVVDAPTPGVLTTWHADRRIEHVHYGWLVVATGAFDRPVAIPGWTLPGVLTAGGAHTLAKAHGVTPGTRILVTGAGPFILSVADVLSATGCAVTTLEATALREQLAGLRVLARDPQLLRQAAGFFLRLTARRARPRYGRIVTGILGDRRVEAAVVERIDADWRRIPGTAETIAVDGVCLGFGFVPRLELAQLLECAIAYDSTSSDYRVVVDGLMRTSQDRVFAAGEVTGVGGVRIAHLEGRIAGLAVAREAGAVSIRVYQQQLRALSRTWGFLQRSADWMQRTYRPRPGLWELAEATTVICRCEDVTVGDAERALRATAADPASIKAATRLGMGLCQGRTCGPYLVEWLRAARGYRPPYDGRPWSVRPPISPVPLDDLATHRGGVPAHSREADGAPAAAPSA
jgi:NADPH-dependent 2,4-dienoyl-CoA reductase/sulfur reductase-like enzyme